MSFASIIALMTALPISALTDPNSISTPISLQMSVVNSSVTVGEPFILRYQMTNNTQQAADIYMGEDKKAWITYRLTDETGHTVAEKIEGDGQSAGLHSNGPRISPSSFSRGYVVASQGVEALKAGRYVLSAHVRMFYQNADIPAARDTFDEDYSFPLTITAADKKKLLASADSLQRIILESKDDGERQAAVETLFSMPESDMKQTWRFLIESPRLSRYTAIIIAKKLATLNSLLSADLLAEMVWDAPQKWDDGNIDASQYLQKLRASGDMQLKGHIDQLFADHGERQSARIIGDID